MFKNNILKNTSFTALSVMAVALWLGSAHAALADASTLGDVLCSGFTNAKPFGKVLQWIAYAAGAVAGVQGIHHARLHTEDPRNHPLHRALMLWFGAMCLLALPSVVTTVAMSLYGGSLTGGSLGCGAGGAGGGGTGLDGMMSGFIDNIKNPIQSVVALTAFLSGLFMMVRGLMKASKFGFDPKANSVHSVLTHIGFGALLMTIGDNLDMMLESVFGNHDKSGGSVISWGGLSALSGGVSSQFTTAVNAALTFVQLIGCIAFVRGWLIMKKVVEGGHGNVTMAQGITHILGGVLAINIGGFLLLMDTTFGTGLLN